MGVKRQPREIWAQTRLSVLERDGWACTRCDAELTVETGHVDHIRSGRHGSNALSNLRALCRRCHVLRADGRHRGMIARAIADGVIPSDWRPLVWDDY
ncbi:MAG TPA: HNH endonuclease signature motif containing protein [Chloroflexota bacterium]|nr:HNH endonuclease signature motif containing protein [Chloroflexota bacterium]HZS89882.1 HNH endonuclease signature motif containing protein [Chloroflexota bacterium]